MPLPPDGIERQNVDRREATVKMMASSTATAIDITGSTSTGDSSGMASLSTMALSPPMSRNRGRESPGGDDVEPLLLGSSSPMSSAGRLGNATNWQQRIPRCLSRVTQTRIIASLFAIFSFSGGVTWIVKGLCVCMGMMLVGGVGSFTLQQMMSPQIDSLLRQRTEMQQEMEELRTQVANWTRIATSRLDMIHMLEKELEKQVVAAAAPPAGGLDNHGGELKKNRVFGDQPMQANFWTTLIYAAILGSIILAVVALRIYQIARTETQRTQKSRASSDFETFPPTEGDVESGLMGAPPTTSLPPKLYKRAPGNAPTDRLVHV